MSSLIYLLTIRLTTLSIGAMTLFLGYRLLIQKNHPQSDSQQTNNSGSVLAGVGEAKIEMKNVASGIFFAGFGTFLIIVTIFANPPQIDIKHSEESSKENGKSTHIKTREITARTDVNQTLKQTARDLHQQAETLQYNGNLKGAYEIEKIAITLQPERDLYVETAADYAFKNKDCSNAVMYIKQAIALQTSNSYYQDKLKQYQKDCH